MILIRQNKKPIILNSVEWEWIDDFNDGLIVGSVGCNGWVDLNDPFDMRIVEGDTDSVTVWTLKDVRIIEQNQYGFSFTSEAPDEVNVELSN